MQLSMDIMEKENVEVDYTRFVDHEVPYGVYPDMTEHGYITDEFPDLFKKVMAADILIIGTPIWLGEKSSVATKLIERLYGMSGKQNDKGQYIYYGKVGGCVITGNEDGIKHCAMSMLYALQHLGYSIPPQADCGWIGEAGPGPSYMDEESGAKNNDFTNRNTTFMTYNLLHLAKMLKENDGYPTYGNSRKDWDDGTRWNFENPEYR
jgi:multimeric flavodoxin WrbA